MTWVWVEWGCPDVVSGAVPGVGLDGVAQIVLVQSWPYVCLDGGH